MLIVKYILYYLLALNVYSPSFLYPGAAYLEAVFKSTTTDLTLVL